MSKNTVQIGGMRIAILYPTIDIFVAKRIHGVSRTRTVESGIICGDSGAKQNAGAGRSKW